MLSQNCYLFSFLNQLGEEKQECRGRRAFCIVWSNMGLLTQRRGMMGALLIPVDLGKGQPRADPWALVHFNKVQRSHKVCGNRETEPIVLVRERELVATGSNYWLLHQHVICLCANCKCVSPFWLLTLMLVLYQLISL